MDFPHFFIVDFPLKIFENIVIGHFPFLLYRTFSFIVHFHGTPRVNLKLKLQLPIFYPNPSLRDTVQRRTLDSLSSLYSIRTVNILFHFKHFRLYKRIVVVDDDVCMHSLKV